MNIFARLGLWLAALIGLACLAIPAYHSLRVYYLSYSGPICAVSQKHDCLDFVNATVTSKEENEVANANGVNAIFTINTSNGSYTVNQDFYSLVNENDQVQIVSLNGKYAFVSNGKEQDNLDAGQQDSATLWAMIIGALLIPFSAATFALFAEDAAEAGFGLALYSPIAFFFGPIPVSICIAIFSGIAGIAISWVLAAATGVVIAAAANKYA